MLDSEITAREKILVVDFGGQYTHLIARRIRELKVYSEVIPPEDLEIDALHKTNVKGIILSGGPRSVVEEDAPKLRKDMLTAGIPVLGICYGHQLIAYLFGGKVGPGERGEYGRATLKILKKDTIFNGFKDGETVWMSHRDQVKRLPDEFETLARTEVTPIAAFKHKALPIYGIQFHPEVSHTPKGRRIFRNFLFKICKCRKSWRPEKIVDYLIEEIKGKVGPREKVLCAVSGGVDSTTTAVIVSRAVGDRLIAVLVNHGLLRKGEAEEALAMLRRLGINPIYIDASERFLQRLKGVRDPEKKRRIIGEEFIKVFEEAVAGIEGVKWLAQGTIYPDRVESGRTGRRTSVIKTHHNVGGLPDRMKLKLLEPLRHFYKDEVRKIAKALGLPKELWTRHPFPGPGLAVRIIGEVNKEKLYIAREASAIVEEELRKAGLYEKVWQAFAVVGDDKWVGVRGDERKVGYIVTVRIVESVDAMTADWAKIPSRILERISERITREIPSVTMVTYAITSKPPSTIEPC